MKRSLILLSSLAVAISATAACGIERQSTVLGPTSAPATAVTVKTSSPSPAGTSVTPGSVPNPDLSLPDVATGATSTAR
jgi:hypothetical protein